MADYTAQDHYKDITSAYDGIEALPHSRITQDLVSYALGDCSGQIILDVGGGSGLHARTAVALGAERVDNVDLSPEMVQNADRAEQRVGRKPGERVRSIVGDATESFDKLDLPGRDGSRLYDTVMVIWTFDHGSTLPELDAMWRNTAEYCCPGGRVVSIRITNPWDRHPSTFKYGVEISDLKAVTGGVTYKYTPKANPPFTCEATAMEAHYDIDQARAMARKFGFDGLSVVPAAEMPCVKEQPEYWQAFLDHPSFCCVIGNKKHI